MAQDLDALVEESTVALPRLVSFDDFEKFLVHLCSETGCRINYRLDSFKYVGSTDNKIRFGSAKLVGSIMAGIYSVSFSSDSIYNENEDIPPEFSEMLFFTVPGYSLKEHPNDERKIWRTVKEIANIYFKTP